MIKYLVAIILGLATFLFLAFALLYLKFGLCKWLYHDILRWHEPDDKYTYDGCSVHSHCKFCGEEIMQDGQGNWF